MMVKRRRNVLVQDIPKAKEAKQSIDDFDREQEREHDSLLQCSLCLETFTEPRGLPCLHAFCFKCIKQYIESRPPTGSFPCPHCNSNTTIPENDVNNFPPYFILNNIIEERQKAKMAKKQKCSNFPRPDASDCGCGELDSLCETCSMWLCKSCTHAHTKIPSLLKHNILSDHDVTERCKIEAKEWNEYILTIKSTMEARIEILKKDARNLDRQMLTIVESINKTAEEYVAIIKERRTTLLEEAKSCYENKSKSLQGWMSEIQDLIKDLAVQEQHLSSVDSNKTSDCNHKILLSAVDSISTQYGSAEERNNENEKTRKNSKLLSEAFTGTLPTSEFKAPEENLLLLKTNGIGKFISDTAVRYTREDYLTVHRFGYTQTGSRTSGVGWPYKGTPNQLRFSCNRDVMLGGVGLYGGGNRTYKANVKIYDISADGRVAKDDGNCLIETGEFEYQCPDRETHSVLFSTPVVVKAKKWYLIWAMIAGEESDFGTNGKNLVITKDGPFFWFRKQITDTKYTCMAAGQFPQLFYKSIHM